MAPRKPNLETSTPEELQAYDAYLIERREYMRKRREEKPERVKQLKQESLARHPETAREGKKRWRQENIEHARDHANTYTKQRRAEDEAFAARERETHRKYYRANKELMLARSKACRDADPERYRKVSRDGNRARHGILDHHRVDELLALQGGVCAICGTDVWGGKYNEPHADHDHTTGKLRAMLCLKHNTLLGAADDDPQILLQAIKVLLNHPAAMLPPEKLPEPPAA